MSILAGYPFFPYTAVNFSINKFFGVNQIIEGSAADACNVVQ